MSSAGILKKPPLKIDEITLLDPDGRYLNDFITDMQHLALLEVGDIAEFIKTGVYPHPLPVVILPNKFDAFGNDADTKQTAVLQSEVDKQYARLNFALQQQRCKMLQFILTHISDESKSKLEREEIMKHIMQRLTLWQCGNCCSSCIALDTAASRRKDRNLLPMTVTFL